MKASTVIRRAGAEVTSRRHEIAVYEAPSDSMMGGGMEGAERTSRETINWEPAMGSPDQIINRVKAAADARGRDMTSNDGHARGAVAVHQDSIVGAQYSLNCTPNLVILKGGGGRRGPKFDDVWETEFSEVVEERFNLTAESEDCWLDAGGRNTFTGLVRMAVGGYVWTGEIASLPLWLRSAGRPCKTAVKMVTPSRISNPFDQPDTANMRRGVNQDANGRPMSYFIRNTWPGDYYLGLEQQNWTEVPAFKPWGRRQFIHIMEQREDGQSRGVADMLSALKKMRMTKHLSEITLQNAIVSASYAAAIESELPPEAIVQMMGGNQQGPKGYMDAIGAYMHGLQAYISQAGNISVDGVKIPHLFPGTKLVAQSLGQPGGVPPAFEQSLQRHIAAALGIGYEEFSRDFSRVSYSSARASMVVTGRFMRARKKMVADRFANQTFQLWFEEEMNAGNFPLPSGVTPDYFYKPLMKEAFTQCEWTGSGTGQIDELKETQAAILRIASGLSTYRKECARFGEDYRKVFRQKGKEKLLQESLSLEFSTDATQTATGASTQKTLSDQSGSNNNNSDAEADAYQDAEFEDIRV